VANDGPLRGSQENSRLYTDNSEIHGFGECFEGGGVIADPERDMVRWPC